MGFRVETSHRGDLQPGDGRHGGEWLAGPSAANPADGQFDDLVLAVEHGIIGSRARPTASPSGTSARSIARQAEGVVLPIPISPAATTRIPSDASFASLVAPRGLPASNSPSRSAGSSAKSSPRPTRRDR